MNLKIGITLFILAQINSQVITGGYQEQQTCPAASVSNHPFDFVSKIQSLLNGFSANNSNLQLVKLETQVVAGLNYRAIFQATVSGAQGFVGITAYVALNGTVSINQFFYSENAQDIIIGLGFSSGTTLSLHCPSIIPPTPTPNPPTHPSGAHKHHRRHNPHNGSSQSSNSWQLAPTSTPGHAHSPHGQHSHSGSSQSSNSWQLAPTPIHVHSGHRHHKRHSSRTSNHRPANRPASNWVQMVGKANSESSLNSQPPVVYGIGEPQVPQPTPPQIPMNNGNWPVVNNDHSCDNQSNGQDRHSGDLHSHQSSSQTSSKTSQTNQPIAPQPVPMNNTTNCDKPKHRPHNRHRPLPVAKPVNHHSDESHSHQSSSQTSSKTSQTNQPIPPQPVPTDNTTTCDQQNNQTQNWPVPIPVNMPVNNDSNNSDGYKNPNYYYFPLPKPVQLTVIGKATGSDY